MADDTYELEFITSLGIRLATTMSVGELRAIRGSGEYDEEPGLDEAEAFRRILRTRIAFLVEKDDGFFVLTDLDGREWVVPQATVVGGWFREPQGSSVRRVEFGPIDAAGAIREG
ncbi:MAG TPA: hypothetical protein VFR93_08830 [Candidatus Limnocylindrales bacterium]|nr:hypothetical protein [Candidatus Limnocylindrales bacterium]